MAVHEMVVFIPFVAADAVGASRVSVTIVFEPIVSVSMTTATDVLIVVLTAASVARSAANEIRGNQLFHRRLSYGYTTSHHR